MGNSTINIPEGEQGPVGADGATGPAGADGVDATSIVIIYDNNPIVFE
jgi:hypothetical protein